MCGGLRKLHQFMAVLVDFVTFTDRTIFFEQISSRGGRP